MGARRRLNRWLMTLALCGLAGCALLGKKRPAAPPERQPRRVGTVALVGRDHSFALIDVGLHYLPPAGRALKAFRDGQETGVLAVSGERNGPFVAADIVGGQPGQGDEIFE